MHGPIEIPTTDQVTVTGLSKPAMIGLGVGVAGLAATLALGTSAGDEMRHFGHSMLVAIVFFLSISLGALFFTLLQHVTSAGWSVVVRRVAEAMTAAFPILGLLVLLVLVAPVWAGEPWIYDWADRKFVEAHELIQHKAGYLNAKFFLIRVIAYFAVWIGVARFFSGQSLAQDVDQDKSRTLKMQGRSGICMIAFGLTLTFAMFDFMMSLNAEWFSTMYGVYMFAGAFWSSLATLALLTMWLEKRGQLKGVVTSSTTVSASSCSPSRCSGATWPSASSCCTGTPTSRRRPWFHCRRGDWAASPPSSWGTSPSRCWGSCPAT